MSDPPKDPGVDRSLSAGGSPAASQGRQGSIGSAVERVHRSILRRLAEGSGQPALEVLGPLVEFLTVADDTTNHICVLRAVVPPGVAVPLHRHDDFEDFMVLSGAHEVLVDDDGHREWVLARAGDYVKVPGDVLHAHRNLTATPAVDLIITTPRIGRFFEEVGRRVGTPPRSAEEIQQFLAVCALYGYQLGTAEENAAVGITL